MQWKVGDMWFPVSSPENRAQGSLQGRGQSPPPFKQRLDPISSPQWSISINSSPSGHRELGQGPQTLCPSNLPIAPPRRNGNLRWRCTEQGHAQSYTASGA